MKIFFNKKTVRLIALSLIFVLSFVCPASDYISSSGHISKAAETDPLAVTPGAVGASGETGEGADDVEGSKKLPENLTYIKEVRLFHGTSKAKAKEAARQTGYSVVEDDLNKGTEKSGWGEEMSDRGSGDCVLLGYKTTKDRTDAITSMRMAEMDTGYQTFNYDEIEKNLNTGMNYAAEDIMSVIAEIKQNDINGDLRAKKVKEALNLYYIPYMNNKGLGDLLFDGGTDSGKIAQVMKRCNLSVLTSLFSYLLMGVSGTELSGQQGNLASRVVANSNKIASMKKSEYVTLDSLYMDDVKQIRKTIQDYANEVEPAVKLLQEEGGELSQSFIDAHPGEALSLQIYNTLNEYTMANGTPLGKHLMMAGATTLKSKDDMRELYPLVMSLSPGQLTMFPYTGVFDAVTYMDISGEKMTIADEALEQVEEKVKETGLDATKDGRVPIYPPNQDTLYRSKVALTSEAMRAASARDEYHKLTQYDKNMEIWDKVFEWTNRILIFSMAACMLGSGVTWVIAHTGAKWILQSTAMKLLIRLGWPIRILGNNMITFVITMVIMAIWYGILKLQESDAYYNPELTEVPRYMYSVEKIDSGDGKKENVYITYTPSYNAYFKYEWNGDYRNTERVERLYCDDYQDIEYNDSVETIRNKETHNKGLISDFNATQGKKWNALYTTKDPRAGSPICAEDVEDIFLVKTGEYNRTINGYCAFSSFGNNNPVNLNSNQYDDDVGGIYLYYKTEKTILDPEATSIIEEGKYVSDLVIVSEEKEKDAKAAIKLKAGKYNFLDQNLTPDQGCFTYLGFSSTENIEDALRDIRVDSISMGNSMSGGYRRNNIGYASVGTTASGDITLYQTAVKSGEKEITDKETLKSKNEDGDEETEDTNSTVMSYSGAPILADFKVVDSLDKAPVGYEAIIPGSGGAAYNFNKNRNKRRYVYFQPAVSYVKTGTQLESKKGVTYVYSDEEYISGIHGFLFPQLGPSAGAKQKMKNRARSLGYTIFDSDLNEKYCLQGKSDEQSNTCYLGYSTTLNPFRALGDIKYYKGNTFSESIQGAASSSEGTYLAMDVYRLSGEEARFITTKDYSGFNYELSDPNRFFTTVGGKDDEIRQKYDARSLVQEPVESWQKVKVKKYYPFAERGMYVLAADEDHPALKTSDILVSKAVTAPSGMRPISHLIYPFMTENFDISTWMGGVHFYIRKEKERRKKYVSGVYVGAFEPKKKMNDEEEYFTYKAADDVAMLQAFAGCNGEVLPTNLAVEPQYAWYNYLDANSTPVKQARYKYIHKDLELNKNAKHYAYMGVSYTDDKDEAITGIVRYKFKGSTAPTKISIGGVKYYKAGSEVGEYCYYTTTSANATPGQPITQIYFDETLVRGGTGTILQTSKTDPDDLQDRLAAVDDDDDLEIYEKILKKAEIRREAVDLRLEQHNKISGHVMVDGENASITELMLSKMRSVREQT